MIKKLIWVIISLIILGLNVQAHRLYGNCTYGSGLYGTNTPPTILDYQPSSLLFSISGVTNITFNITATDYDCESFTIEWYVNGTLNVSNQNLSYLFSNSGVYNITVNLSDNLDNTYQTWSVTLNTTAASVSIIDILIVPLSSQSGNLIIITANVTSSINATNIATYLNINSDFVFLSETPRNQTIGAVWTNNATQVRWFVFAPATPPEATYYTNVSYTTNSSTIQGQTKKLNIETSEKMGITASIILIGIALLFFVISFSLNSKTHGALKLLFLVFSILMIPIALNYVYLNSIETGASVEVQNTLQGVYRLSIYAVVLFLAYIVIYYIYSALMFYKMYAKR